jgi:hypothetical protein
MKTLKEKAPALWTIFFKSYALVQLERPYGCSDCIFAKEHGGWDSQPNPADRDEGYYDCQLINKEKIWGENPQCTSDNWREKGEQEVGAIAEFTIQQELINEAADALIYEFAKALKDEKNGDLTIRQINEQLLSGVDPRVLNAFNTKLRPQGRS